MKTIFLASLMTFALAIHVSGQSKVLSSTSTAVTYYYYDGTGNTVALANVAENVVEKYTYDVFGKPTIKDGNENIINNSAFGNRFMFTGREYIQELGVYDYRNRIFHQSLGRFMQTDPIRFYAGDINIYRYVNNNSINKKDPSGMCYASGTTNYLANELVYEGPIDWNELVDDTNANDDDLVHEGPIDWNELVDNEIILNVLVGGEIIVDKEQLALSAAGLLLAMVGITTAPVTVPLIIIAYGAAAISGYGIITSFEEK